MSLDGWPTIKSCNFPWKPAETDCSPKKAKNNVRSKTSHPANRFDKQHRWGLRSSDNLYLLKAAPLLEEEARLTEEPRIPEVKSETYQRHGAWSKLHPTNRHITVNNALVYLKLRHDQCSRKEALRFTSRLRCMTDSTQKFDGPPGLRTLERLDNKIPGTTFNGWSMTPAEYNLGQKYMQYNSIHRSKGSYDMLWNQQKEFLKDHKIEEGVLQKKAHMDILVDVIKEKQKRFSRIPDKLLKEIKDRNKNISSERRETLIGKRPSTMKDLFSSGRNSADYLINMKDDDVNRMLVSRASVRWDDVNKMLLKRARQYNSTDSSLRTDSSEQEDEVGALLEDSMESPQSDFRRATLPQTLSAANLHHTRLSRIVSDCVKTVSHTPAGSMSVRTITPVKEGFRGMFSTPQTQATFDDLYTTKDTEKVKEAVDNVEKQRKSKLSKFDIMTQQLAKVQQKKEEANQNQDKIKKSKTPKINPNINRPWNLRKRKVDNQTHRQQYIQSEKRRRAEKTKNKTESPPEGERKRRGTIFEFQSYLKDSSPDISPIQNEKDSKMSIRYTTDARKVYKRLTDQLVRIETGDVYKD